MDLPSTIQPETRRGLPWYFRFSIKWLILALVVLFVLFPDPRLLVRNVRHISNLNAMIDEKDPDLRKWVAEFDVYQASLAPVPTQPAQTQRAVEKFVYAHVPYQWDWELYGAADYMPTVAEMFEYARQRPDGKVYEDCDGRAVMCASMLRAMGFDARIVTDLQHVWVETPLGPLMGPGMTPAMQSSAAGNRTNLAAAGSNALTALSFGMSVFPFWREFVIWAAVVLLSVHRRMGWKAALLGAALTLQGLLFVRSGVISKPDFRWLSQSWPATVGVIHIVVGLLILWIASFRARRRADVAK